MLRSFVVVARRYWGHGAVAAALALVVVAGVAVVGDGGLIEVGVLVALAIALSGVALIERRTTAQYRDMRQMRLAMKETAAKQEALGNRLEVALKKVTADQNVRADRLQASAKAASVERQAADEQLLRLLSDIEGRRRLDEVMRATEFELLQKETVDALEHLERGGDRFGLADATALFTLFQLLPLEGPPTLPTDFTASPRTMQSLVTEVLSRPGPLSIVECGSGASTVWLAAACRRAGAGKVIALEHNERYAWEATHALQLCGLSDYAEVRHAPLAPLSLDDQKYWWYDATAYDDIAQIDLLFVDGPPGSTGPLARYPALSLLAHTLSPDALIVVDDIERPEEAAVVQRWMDHHRFGENLVETSRAGRAALLRWNGSRGVE